jgi:hypothetical protein
MKRLFIILLISINVYAQEDYQKWLQKENDKFKSYLSEEDKKFGDFLKNEWKAFDLQNGVAAEKTPKPVKPPVSNKNIEGIPQNNIEEKKVTDDGWKEENKNADQKNLSTTLIPTEKEQPDLSVVNFFFVDDNEEIYYPKKLDKISITEFTNEKIGNYWEEINSVNLNDFMTEINEYKKLKNINDWGYFTFLWKLSNKIKPENKSESILLTWVLLIKSGYKVKVGLMDNEVMLFVKSKEAIYNIAFFKEGNEEKTYIINFESSGKTSGRLFTYEGDYPNSEKYLSLMMNESPTLKTEELEKDFKLRFHLKDYAIHVRLNKNMINYYKDYPSTQYSTFFNAQVSSEINNTLIPALKEATKGMDKLEAVNLIMRFVQTCFDYKTDDQNFGREKSLFVEETLFYPYSDCEDRAILFSYLVKNVLNMKVVGIDYPGHMATAVAIGDGINGDYIVSQGEKYIICDPTYINADAGKSMPDYPVSIIENVIHIK